MSETDLVERAQELAAQIQGMAFGSIKVLQAKVEVAPDDEDELAVFLYLILSDPPGNTWPYDDVLGLRRATIKLALAGDVDSSIHLRLSPATDMPQEDDESVLFGV